MEIVVAIEAALGCRDCTAISHFALSDGSRITRMQAYARAVTGKPLKVGSPDGPSLIPVVREGVQYVRAHEHDVETDPLLGLPRLRKIRN